MSFHSDLAYGVEKEELVLKRVQRKYPEAYRVDGYFKEWDIYIPEKKIGIEVKSDRMSHKTGNVVIEYSYGGEPSGIQATKATWWVYITNKRLYWITPRRIKECIKDNELNPQPFAPIGEDIKPKSLYLIREKIFRDYTSRSERLGWQRLM